MYFLMQNYNCHHCKDHSAKKVRRDPANPAWDPRFVPGGIPTGILEPPTWDPALNPRWDPANPTRDPSYILDKIPHGIWPQIPGGIPPIPPGIPASFHAKSRQSHLGSQICTMWDPRWDPTISLRAHLFVTQTGSHLLSFLITHKSQFQLWNVSKLSGMVENITHGVL